MSMEPVRNPSLPGEFDINGMFVGKSIIVFGQVKQDAARFDINFMSGDDIAFHFNPRFNEKQVVRNTRKGGWGPEERDGAFPFAEGRSFAVIIKCLPHHFRIQANSYKVFTTYKHRIPPSSIDKLTIKGDCDIRLLTSSIDGTSIATEVVYSPDTPAEVDIPFFNIREHSVKVVGRPTSDDGRFSINLQTKGGKIIYFHLNPRMNEKQIVRNTRDDGSWGSEERDLGMPFPFIKDVPFEIKISVEKRRYTVELNGSTVDVLSYAHRIKRLKRIDEVVVSGDVKIEKILFE